MDEMCLPVGTGSLFLALVNSLRFVQGIESAPSNY